LDIEKKLIELNITLPNTPKPIANYVPSKKSGNLIFLSGQGPRTPDGDFISGKVGVDISVDEAYDAARVVGIQLLSALKSEITDLNNVKQIIKLLGMVNAIDSFKDHPNVINGCSDLLVEVFGEKGKHARSAVGVASLPNQIPVEIEMIVEVE
jgi:enamine deaminase RidA (YjgF/YER057c/UK114 family)|tara:strand:+ start:1677 stop:2135 length:459 start_codon:yes stop_codon:yes gene_type:complete